MSMYCDLCAHVGSSNDRAQSSSWAVYIPSWASGSHCTTQCPAHCCKNREMICICMHALTLTSIPTHTHTLSKALHDYQPSLVDAQLMQAWLTVMKSAHTSLAHLDNNLCVGHLPKLFTCCVSCFLSEKPVVTQTAASVMEVCGSDVIVHRHKQAPQ